MYWSLRENYKFSFKDSDSKLSRQTHPVVVRKFFLNLLDRQRIVQRRSVSSLFVGKRDLNKTGFHINSKIQSACNSTHIGQADFKVESFSHLFLRAFSVCTVEHRHVDLELMVSSDDRILKAFFQKDLVEAKVRLVNLLMKKLLTHKIRFERLDLRQQFLLKNFSNQFPLRSRQRNRLSSRSCGS